MLPIIIFKSGAYEQFKNVTDDNINVVQAIPFKTIIANFSSISGLIQLIGNLLLLMPIVFIMKYLSKKAYSNKWILFVVVCISIGIECIQFINVKLTHFPTHSIDIDDFILNVLGSILAISLLNFINKKLRT